LILFPSIGESRKNTNTVKKTIEPKNDGDWFSFIEKDQILSCSLDLLQHYFAHVYLEPMGIQ